jgi:hypothetical protein
VITNALRSLWAEPRAAHAPARGWRDWVLVGVLMGDGAARRSPPRRRHLAAVRDDRGGRTRVIMPDGSPRFVWTDTRPDARTYARVLLASIAERQRWREQYVAAKSAVAGPVDSPSATTPPADSG